MLNQTHIVLIKMLTDSWYAIYKICFRLEMFVHGALVIIVLRLQQVTLASAIPDCYSDHC